MTEHDLQGVFHRRGWLAAQPEEFRKAWLNLAEFSELSVGELLFSLGGPPGGVYGIAEGYADVLIASGYITPALAHIARPGWWVGEATALTGSPRRVEIRARTDLKVCCVSLQGIESLEAQFPRLWRTLAQLTVLHLDNALMYASAVTKGDARTKILSTLIRLAGPEMTSDAVISVPCTQQELGEMAGLHRNSAGPVLRSLERDGLIARVTYSQIAYNPVRLAHISEKELSSGAR
ncbi:Crp/Fnr family transcriptional regulator [Paracoccus ravus]|uniref:Crp/Fnr family transcriptional regulator n=1 Tax=Paracoccus ravus TaxID=2447760 RepID=UPI00106DDF5D|nr:Crp/Fnr family transcriptional regulator [Paracoccus ravus]